MDRSKCEVAHSKAEKTYWLILLLLTLLLPIALTLASNAGLQCYIAKLHKREREIMLKLNPKGNELNNGSFQFTLTYHVVIIIHKIIIYCICDTSGT